MSYITSRNFLFSLTISILVIFSLITLSQPAKASGGYALIGGVCYDSYGATFPISYCTGNDIGQIESVINTQNAPAQQIMQMIQSGILNNLITSNGSGSGSGASGSGASGSGASGASGGSGSLCGGGISSFPSCDIPAASSLLSRKGFSVTGGLRRTGVSSSALAGNGSRLSLTSSLALGYTKDYGDWGFKTLLPLQHSWNNNAYSAFDNTSIGIALMPFYHVLHEQIHGIDLDVGAVIGHQYVHYQHKSALAASPTINFAGFDNLSEGQIGIFTRGAKTVASGGKILFGTSFLDNHNYNNTSHLGRDTTDWTTDIGYAQGLGPKTAGIADIRLVSLAQYPSHTSATYGEAILGISSHLNNHASLAFNVNQTFANPDWSTTDIRLSFNWDLN